MFSVSAEQDVPVLGVVSVLGALECWRISGLFTSP